MANQPVRKIIQQTYNTLENVTERTLLIDGQNILEVSINGDKDTINEKGEHIGGIYQFFLQLKKFMTKIGYTFDNIYVFWDGKLSGKLRYELYPDYKAQRGKNYEANLHESDYNKSLDDFVRRTLAYSHKKRKMSGEDIKAKCKVDMDSHMSMLRQRQCIMEYLEELFIKQIWDSTDEVVEGDDLIAYYCLHRKKGEQIVIASGDRDLTQLINDNIAVYVPVINKYIHCRNYKDYFNVHYENIVLAKTLCGDSSDNIKGIKGLGEKTMLNIMPEMSDRKVTLDEFLKRTEELAEARANEKKKPLAVHTNILNRITEGCQGNKIYEINSKIINLKAPMITENCRSMMDEIDSAIDPEGRSISNLYSMIKRDGITMLYDVDVFSRFFIPFQNKIEKEKKKYQKFLTESK